MQTKLLEDTPDLQKSNILRKFVTGGFGLGTHIAGILIFILDWITNVPFLLINGPASLISCFDEDEKYEGKSELIDENTKLGSIKNFLRMTLDGSKDHNDKSNWLSFAFGVLTAIPYYLLSAVVKLVGFILAATLGLVGAVVGTLVGSVVKFGEVIIKAIQHKSRKRKHKNKKYNYLGNGDTFSDIISETWNFGDIAKYIRKKIKRAVYAATDGKRETYVIDGETGKANKIEFESLLNSDNKTIQFGSFIGGMKVVSCWILVGCAQPNLLRPKGQQF